MKKLFLIPAAVLVLVACDTEPKSIGTPNATEVVATQNASENASNNASDSSKVCDKDCKDKK